jgi:hypothetical protein
MSDFTNENLLDEAPFYIEYFAGTTLGEVLQSDVEHNDLESLHYHLKDAKATAFNLEYNPELV